MSAPVKRPRLVSRILAAALAAMAAGLLAPSAALASGATDFQITMFGFAVIALFMILPAVLSFVQHRLETRREREREQLERVRKP